MAAGPNALRGSGPNPNLAFEDALTLAGSPHPGNDRVCITSLCPHQFLVTSACRQLRCRQQLRLLESLAAHHHGPRHACDFVSKCNGSDLDRPTLHQTSEPQPLRAVLARISDDSHGAGDEQPAQMSIALLRDPAKSLFAPGRMLSRHQADPRSETAARRELLPISHLSHQRGGDDRANTRDFLQPPAFLTRAVPGVDAFLDGHDLCPDNRILASKDVEAEPRGRWNAIILLVSDDLEQFRCAIAALSSNNAEFGHVPTDGIRQHRSLTNQKLPAAMQHQAGLLLFRLRCHKSHRRP